MFMWHILFLISVLICRLETTKLLLRSGASYTAKSRYGDDALQTSCLKSATRIFEFLTANIRYPPERLANGHELMGATFLDEHNDVQVALYHWKKALTIRQQYSTYQNYWLEVPVGFVSPIFLHYM